jgi:hypothetical protein
MTVIHSLNYLDITYNTNGAITIQMINNLANMLGVQNCVSPANLQTVINLLIKDYNFFTLMSQLDSLLKSHPKYNSTYSSASANGDALYDTSGASVSLSANITDVSTLSAYTFLTQSEQLLTLSTNISRNALLQNLYVASTNRNINNKLITFRADLKAYSSNVTSDQTTTALNYDDDFSYGFCPLFNVWSSASVALGSTATTYATSLKTYITPLVGNDMTFLRFFSQIIFLGINNLVGDINNQNVIVNYGLDILQIMDTLAGALNVPVFSNDDKTTLSSDYNFLLFASTVQRILTISIPIINDVKNKVMMNGLPSYYIVYALFIICMANNRNDMISMASLNLNSLATGSYGGQLYFYATGTSTSVTTTGSGYTVGKTYSTSGTDTIIEVDNTTATSKTTTTTVYSVDFTDPTTNLLFVQLGFV